MADRMTRILIFFMMTPAQTVAKNTSPTVSVE